MENILKHDKEFITNNSVFTNVTFRSSKKATKRDVEDSEKALNRALPTALKDFYLQVSQKIHISWNAYDKLGRIMHIGRCKIRKPSKLLDQTLVYSKPDSTLYDDKWYSNQFSKISHLPVDRLFILDDLGQGNIILIFLPLDSEIHELYLYKHPNYFKKIELSVGDYLKLTLNFKGLYLWQALFIDASHTGALMGSSIKEFLNLFPYANSFLDGFTKEQLNRESYWEKTGSYNVDYYAKVENLRQKLTEKHTIEVKHFITEYGVDLQTIDRISRTYPKALKTEALDFYRQYNGLEIQWFHKSKANATGGMVKLLSLEKVFGGEQGKWVKDWNTESFVDMLWFEIQRQNAKDWVDKLVTLLPLEAIVDAKWLLTPKSEPFAQLFLSTIEEVYQIELTFAKYLDIVFKVGGIENWQYFLISPQVISNFDRMEFDTLTLKELFPEVDLKQLRNSIFS